MMLFGRRKTTRSGALSALLWLVALALALPPAQLAESIIWAHEAEAAGYNDGYRKYQRGDFKGAERALQDALKTKLGKDEVVKTLKLLGMCQFNTGNNAGSATSFKRALALNPSLTIGSSEAIVPEVIPFFNKVKASAKAAPAPVAAGGAKGKGQQTALVKTAAKTGKAAPVPPAKAQPLAPGGGGTPTGKSKEVKHTTLIVKSTTPNAKVWIDGLIKGDVNQVLDMDPGPTIVEVQLQGYITKKVNVTIVKNRENTITADLEKPKPKPKPVPKPKPQPARNGGSGDLLAMEEGGVDPYGDIGALEGAKDVKNGRGKKGRGKPKKAKGDLFAPDPGDDQFYSDPRGGGGHPQGPNAAQQYQMESGGGGYGAPMGGGYAPPPMAYGYAPPPMYYQPPPPMYYQPPPPPPPPPMDSYASGDPYAAGGGGVPGDPAGYNGGVPGGDPSVIADPAGGDPDRGDGRRAQKCEQGNIMISLLPFGAGQFQNCNMLFGVVFAGAEAGALYLWYANKKDAEDTTLAINARTTQYQNSETPHSTEEDEAEAKYRGEVAAYVANAQQTSNMGLYGFFALWALGVGEAIINAPPGPASKKKKKRGAKPRKYSGFSQVAPETPEESPHVASAYEPKVQFGATFKPVYDPEIGRVAPAPAFELRLNF